MNPAVARRLFLFVIPTEAEGRVEGSV